MLGEETDLELPLDTITPNIMDRVLEFLEYHATNPMKEIAKPIATNNMVEIVGEWDANFMALEDDHDTMVDLVLAGNYLNCQPLLNLGILKIATMLKDKEPAQVREMFHIDNVITSEEEKEIRDANQWVFDVNVKKE